MTSTRTGSSIHCLRTISHAAPYRAGKTGRKRRNNGRRISYPVVPEEGCRPSSCGALESPASVSHIADRLIPEMALFSLQRTPPRFGRIGSNASKPTYRQPSVRQILPFIYDALFSLSMIFASIAGWKITQNEVCKQTAENACLYFLFCHLPGTSFLLNDCFKEPLDLEPPGMFI